MCVYMILQAPKTCCQTALEEEKKKKKRGEQCRKRVKQVNRKGKGKRKRWQRANESLKEGNREGRQRKRERGAEFPPGGINTARWSRAQ